MSKSNKRKVMDESMPHLKQGFRVGLRLSGEPRMVTEREKINELNKEIKELLKTAKDNLGGFGLSKTPRFNLKTLTAYFNEDDEFQEYLTRFYMDNNANSKYILTKNLEKINKLYKQVWDIEKATKKELEKRKQDQEYKEYVEKNNQSWEKWNDSRKSGQMVGEYKDEPIPVYYEKDDRQIYKVMPNQGIMSNSSMTDVMTTSSLNKATHKELYPLRKYVYDKTKTVRDIRLPQDEPVQFHTKKKDGGRKTRIKRKTRKRNKRKIRKTKRKNKK